MTLLLPARTVVDPPGQSDGGIRARAGGRPEPGEMPQAKEEVTWLVPLFG
jgi:hypothetical protein